MIQLVIRHAYPSTKSHPVYECTLDEWDLGTPICYGSNIQDAIDDFLCTQFIDKGEEIPEYKWKAKPTFYG